MRRRRRHVSVVLVLGLILCFLCLYYLSNCAEISYVVQLTNVARQRRPVGEAAAATAANCETVHVAIVCAGHESATRVATLVKSLLFHRRNPIHLHLIVDTAVTLPIVQTLLRTWTLPALEVSFYASESAEPQVNWIRNRHYSGVYGLLKLTLPSLLPSHLTRVLVLDTDVLFVADVADLWHLWLRFGSRQALGLVENMSDWYLGKLWKHHQPWPALGRGFNTGVILMDLERLRSLGWLQLWQKIAKKNLYKLDSTALADQDIFNAVLSEYPEMLFNLPCEWNLQLGDRSLQHLCQTDIADLKVVHWNSPHKTRVRSRYGDFFRRHFETFAEMDGAFVRRELLRCPNASATFALATPAVDVESAEYDDGDGCLELRNARNLVYRTHLYYTAFDYTAKAADVSLVVQLSVDRLQSLVRLVEQWDGPASVAIYASDSDARQLTAFVADSPLLSRRRDVAIHLVYKQGTFYPINYLRNVALTNVVTPFVYLSDVDFLPMFGLYDSLRQAVVAQGDMRRRALVVPAFETQRYRFEMPRSKAALLNQLDSGQLLEFRRDVWTRGHTATDFDRWRNAAAPYSVGWTADFEPYMVVARHVVPFDTRFLGFGWNKVSHTMHLNALGYDFVVLPNAFMVHLPHTPSLEIAKYRTSGQYRKCLKIIKGEFIKDLAKQNSIPARVIALNASQI